MTKWVVLRTTNGRVMVRLEDIRRLLEHPDGGNLTVELVDGMVTDVTDNLESVIRDMGFEPIEKDVLRRIKEDIG